MDTLNTRELTQWFTLWISLWWFFDDLHNHFRRLNQEITNLYHNIASGVKTNGLYIFLFTNPRNANERNAWHDESAVMHFVATYNVTLGQVIDVYIVHNGVAPNSSTKQQNTYIR